MDKSIKQKLLSGGLWVIGGKILAFFSGLAVISCLTRLLPPDKMGVYFLILSIVNISVLFSSLGMERSIVRIVSESMSLDQTERAYEAVKYVLQFGLVSSAFVAISLVSGVGHFVSTKIFDSFLISDIIYYPAIWLILFTFQRLIAEAFRGFHDIRFATIFNGLVSSIISSVVFLFILCTRQKANIDFALFVTISAYAINLIFAFPLLLKKLAN